MTDDTEARRAEGVSTRGEENKDSPPTVAPHGAADDMPKRLGRYVFKKKLGAGGMGAVYLVENTELQREEALKLPHFDSSSDSSMRERFLREARAAAKLDNPNLCPIYDAGVIDGVYFLTMRLLPGKPLADFTGRPQPPRDALKIVIKLAGALEHAHRKGVIHRDLKPSNIMMCPGTGPTVMDFGLAKQTLQRDLKLTQTGMTMGTPSYMPPEQVKGELDQIGPASDVYSLGVILFELLTGQVPFTGAMAEVMAKVLFSESPLPSQFRPGLDPALDAACARAMAKQPRDRFASMKEFGGALFELLNATPRKEESGAAAPPAAVEMNTPGILNRTTAAPDEGVAVALPPRAKKEEDSKGSPLPGWRTAEVPARATATPGEPAEVALPPRSRHPAQAPGSRNPPPPPSNPPVPAVPRALPALPPPSPRRKDRPAAHKVPTFVYALLAGALISGVLAAFVVLIFVIVGPGKSDKPKERPAGPPGKAASASGSFGVLARLPGVATPGLDGA